MIAAMIGGVLDPIILKTLLGSGSSKILINKSATPKEPRFNHVKTKMQ